MHVDAASGGFVAPFLHPDLAWDFRLPHGEVDQRVRPQVRPRRTRASASWCGASADDLPEDLIFHVNYLGGDMPTFTLNFSRPGNQIVGQYYNFLRLGRDGYRRVMESLRDVAVNTCRAAIAEMGPFELVSDGTAIPVLRVHDEGPAAVHGLRRVGPAAHRRVAGARLHDAGRMRPTSPCSGSWFERASAWTSPTASLDALAKAVAHLRGVPAAAPGTRAGLQPHVTVGP